MKKILISAAAFALLLAPLSLAIAGSLDLSSAKSAGLVGEKPDGLIGAVTAAPSADVKALVEETNSGRSAVYKDTAAKQGLSAAQVGSIAAQKMFDRAAPGEFLFINGAWVKK